MYISEKFRKSLLFIFITLLCACSHQASTSESSSHAKIGVLSKEELFVQAPLFKNSYKEHIVLEQEKQQISSWPNNLRIDIYFGTWCHDSEREVPRLLSILDQNPDISSTLIALDRNKEDPQMLARKDEIKYTPTFVVYLGDKKIGRIVERPIHSLVQDITDIYLKSLKVID